MVQISDGARDFQNPVVRTGRKAHLPDGHLERAFAGIVQCALFADQAHRHPCIHKTARLLHGPSLFYAPANVSRRLAHAIAAQLLIRNGRNFDVNVDTIEQRPADLAQVPLDDAGRTAAFARSIAKEAARAPVQISTALSMKLECRATKPPQGSLTI
jgi:hypothetical protein